MDRKDIESLKYQLAELMTQMQMIWMASETVKGSQVEVWHRQLSILLPTIHRAIDSANDSVLLDRFTAMLLPGESAEIKRSKDMLTVRFFDFPNGNAPSDAGFSVNLENGSKIEISSVIDAVERALERLRT